MEEEFKKMIQEAVREETQGLREEIKRLEEIVATERIGITKAKRILGFKDQRTAQKHLEKAGIEPVFDEESKPKYIKKEIVDYARNKHQNIEFTS